MYVLFDVEHIIAAKAVRLLDLEIGRVSRLGISALDTSQGVKSLDVRRNGKSRTVIGEGVLDRFR